MKTGAIVQARMSSRRFPGKVMHLIAGKPLLQYLLERLNKCQALNTVVIATSTDATDTVIEEFCSKQGIACVRGPLENVAKRFRDAALELRFDAFLRVNGDSPFLDCCLIEKGMEIYRQGNYDMVTNVLERTFPKGQSIEIIKSGIFCEAYECMSDSDDLEHVTKYFYRNKERYKIFNFCAESDYSGIQLSVDTAQDMDIFTNVLARMDKPHWNYGWKDVLKLQEDVVSGEKCL